MKINLCIWLEALKGETVCEYMAEEVCIVAPLPPSINILGRFLTSLHIGLFSCKVVIIIAISVMCAEQCLAYCKPSTNGAILIMSRYVFPGRKLKEMWKDCKSTE